MLSGVWAFEKEGYRVGEVAWGEYAARLCASKGKQLGSMPGLGLTILNDGLVEQSVTGVYCWFSIVEKTDSLDSEAMDIVSSRDGFRVDATAATARLLDRGSCLKIAVA